MRLLKAGHPWQPSAPPVPLQRPPPGHVPFGIWEADMYAAPGVLGAVFEPDGDVPFTVEGCREDPETTMFGGFLRLVGRAAFLAF